MKRFLTLFAVLALALISAQVQAQNDNPFEFINYELDNGLEVILVPDSSAPTVAVNIWYDVGSADDPAGRSGFAHLFEHMMFEDSARLSAGERDLLIEGAGGFLNAYVTIERTVYFETLPANQLPLALWLEADRMGSLGLSQENLNNQRAIVIEEYQFRVANQPNAAALQTLLFESYDYAPYNRWTIGNVDDLNNATLDDVRDFHANYYKPNNATLTVVGDIDVEQTRALIEQYFDPIPRQDDPPPLPEYVPSPRTAPEIRDFEDPLARVPVLALAHTLPERSHPDYAAAILLSDILSGGNSSRFAQNIVDSGLATTAFAGTSGNRGPGLFYMYFIPREGVELETIEEAYRDELNRIMDEGIPAEELEKVINQIQVSRVTGLETAFSLAEAVQSANFYFGDPSAVFTEIDRLSDVTEADIQRVIETYLQPQTRFEVRVVPVEGDPEPVPAAVIDDAADPEDSLVATHIQELETPPEPLPIDGFELPAFTETALDNGMEVVVIERDELPIVSAGLYLPGGDAAVPDGLTGLGDLTASLLNRGTENRTAQEIALEIEQIGGSLGANSARDWLEMSVLTLSEDVDTGFDLLGDIALNPVFMEDELELERDSALTSLQGGTLTDPFSLAARAFNRVLYPDHPYGNQTTVETLEAITRDDITDYYAAQLNPANAVLVIAGDIDADTAIALAEDTFGDLAPLDETFAYPPVPVQVDGMQVYIVDRPGPQTRFIVGNLSADARDPNVYNLRVMNEILGGGGLSSRLARNVREEKGYAYTVGSGFRFSVDDGVFFATAASDNEVAPLAIEETIREIEIMRTEEVPADELETIKQGLIGSEALQIESLGSFIGSAASLKLNGLPLDRIGNTSQRYALVDAATVQEVAQQYITPENFVIIAVGDASVIEEPLSAFGPVTILDEE
ncbi:MAG: pitrilysin family protein [Chloroflexota bacterium]